MTSREAYKPSEASLEHLATHGHRPHVAWGQSLWDPDIELQPMLAFHWLLDCLLSVCVQLF